MPIPELASKFYLSIGISDQWTDPKLIPDLVRTISQHTGKHIGDAFIANRERFGYFTTKSLPLANSFIRRTRQRKVDCWGRNVTAEIVSAPKPHQLASEHSAGVRVKLHNVNYIMGRRDFEAWVRKETKTERPERRDQVCQAHLVYDVEIIFAKCSLGTSQCLMQFDHREDIRFVYERIQGVPFRGAPLHFRLWQHPNGPRVDLHAKSPSKQKSGANGSYGHGRAPPVPHKQIVLNKKKTKVPPSSAGGPKTSIWAQMATQRKQQHKTRRDEGEPSPVGPTAVAERPSLRTQNSSRSNDSGSAPPMGLFDAASAPKSHSSEQAQQPQTPQQPTKPPKKMSGSLLHTPNAPISSSVSTDSPVTGTGTGTTSNGSNSKPRVPPLIGNRFRKQTTLHKPAEHSVATQTPPQEEVDVEEEGTPRQQHAPAAPPNLTVNTGNVLTDTVQIVHAPPQQRQAQITPGQPLLQTQATMLQTVSPAPVQSAQTPTQPPQAAPMKIQQTHQAPQAPEQLNQQMSALQMNPLANPMYLQQVQQLQMPQQQGNGQIRFMNINELQQLQQLNQIQQQQRQFQLRQMQGMALNSNLNMPAMYPQYAGMPSININNISMAPFLNNMPPTPSSFSKMNFANTQSQPQQPPQHSQPQQHQPAEQHVSMSTPQMQQVPKQMPPQPQQPLQPQQQQAQPPMQQMRQSQPTQPPQHQAPPLHTQQMQQQQQQQPQHQRQPQTQGMQRTQQNTAATVARANGQAMYADKAQRRQEQPQMRQQRQQPQQQQQRPGHPQNAKANQKAQPTQRAQMAAKQKSKDPFDRLCKYCLLAVHEPAKCVWFNPHLNKQ